MRNLIMYVLVPGITGFAMAYIFVIPRLIAAFPALASSNVASVAATGILTFVLASVLRGRSKAETPATEAIDMAPQRA